MTHNDDQYTADKSSWRETRCLNGHDQFLRRRGWSILRRRGDNEAVWKHADGREATEGEALSEERKKEAE